MPKKRTVVVAGVVCEVLDRLGYSHSVGKYAIEVMHEGQERIVTSYSRSGPWEFHRPVFLVPPPVAQPPFGGGT